MTKFFYKAKDREGKAISGAIEADDPWLARKALLKLNLIVLEINRFNFTSFLEEVQKFSARFARKLTVEERIIFTSQLETGYSVGIPILQVLNLVYEETTHPGLKEAISKIIADIQEGSSLHAAFAKHPQLFDNVFINLIRTGEIAGELETVLGRIIQITERQAANKAKVKTATFYPKLVIGFMLMALLVVVYFVIPKIKIFLKSLGQDLPPITQFVVGLSDFFVTYWYLIAAAAIGIKFGVDALLRQPKNVLRLHRFFLKMPVLGPLFIQLELNNFCILLDLLIGSGIPLVEGLEIVGSTQTNLVFRNETLRCRTEIEQGGSLSSSMSTSPVFPPSFNGLVSIGEESGRLQTVLQRLGKYYQVQIDYRLDNLSKLIEPFLLAVIFAMVLVLALAIFLPIWKMSSAVRSKG